jgi:hypothetical protein
MWLTYPGVMRVAIRDINYVVKWLEPLLDWLD